MDFLFERIDDIIYSIRSSYGSLGLFFNRISSRIFKKK